ncbi:MAG TPA: hypothetical protein VJ866_17590 [Pyrinomonadaceae bacterium]|nr:hypothetical protein [Pyrinomonadaceae bacterium]
MILGKAHSVNGVPIRLTDERWEHIINGHAEFSYNDTGIILEAVEDPEYILRGRAGSLVAVVALGRGSYLHVVYKEVTASDGFVVTAVILPSLDRKKIIWRR